MSYRNKLVLAITGAIAFLGILTIGSVYFVAKGEAVHAIDQGLRDQSQKLLTVLSQRPTGESDDGSVVQQQARQLPAPDPGEPDEGTVVLVTPTEVLKSSPREALFNAAQQAIKDHRTSLFTESRNGETYRVLLAWRPGAAIQISRSLDQVQQSIDRTSQFLLIVLAVIIILGGFIGFFLAERLLRPIRRLSGVIEEIHATDSLNKRVDIHGEDELAQLGIGFNNMLERLEDDAAEREAFIQNASHELRTPATIILGNAEMLQGKLDPAARQAALDDLLTESHELAKLINQLLIRVEEEDDEDFDLYELLSATVHKHADRSNKTWNLQGETREIHSSPLAWEVIFDNLLRNAEQWAQSTITITLSHDIVGVSNDGPLVADDDQEKIFRRFYRSEEAKGKQGSGLGLHIVADLLGKVGGSIRCETVDEQTCFRITLPQ